MNLKRQLARLPRSTATRAAARETSPATERERVLDDLRGKMNAILVRSNEADAAPTLAPERCADFSELGFERHERGEHWCWRRRLAQKASHHVGRMPVAGTSGLDPRILSLLALDPGLEQCDFGRALFLDTETTGLGGGAGTIPFLLGLAYYEDGRLVADQLLLEGPEQEPAMLETLREICGHCEVLVTFNGKAFDWPLLEGRYVMNALAAVDRLPHLDLLHVARRIHRRRLGRCTLKNIESAVLGFEREGDVEGAEVASRYTHYLRSGDASGLVQVVDHNTWDVISMAALVALYGEPLPALTPEDRIGLARTYQRAKALPEALAAAQSAVSAGVGAEALKQRGEVQKARGERLAALADFEAANEELQDPGLRLALAKLYEHVVRRPDLALAVVGEGTTEKAEAAAKRRARLQSKLDKAGQASS